jgi:hypothetical protein
MASASVQVAAIFVNLIGIDSDGRQLDDGMAVGRAGATSAVRIWAGPGCALAFTWGISINVQKLMWNFPDSCSGPGATWQEMAGEK